MMRYIKADKKVIDALFEDNIRSCDTLYRDSFYWTQRRQSHWECNECGALWCKEERGWIEERIKRLDNVWTNVNDWEPPDRDFLN